MMMTQPVAPPVSRPVRLIEGLLALLVLLAIVVGVPLLLTALGTIPAHVPSTEGISHALTTRDDGQLLGKVLAAGVWICWALFTLSVLPEIAAALRRRPAFKIPGLGGFQRPAARLIAIVMVAFTLAPMAITSAGGAFAAPATRAPARSNVIATATATVATPTTGHRPAPRTPATPSAGVTAPRPHPVPASQSREHSAVKTYTVATYDTLWGIAQQHLGDGLRYQEIVDLNQGIIRADNEIVAGDVLRLPADAVGLTAPTATHRDETPSLPASRVETVVEVQPGDTLSSIEQSVTGDAADWPAAWTANAGRAEPGGVRYDDPNLIRPGWTLRIPGQPTVTPPAVVIPTSVTPPTAVAPAVTPPAVVAPKVTAPAVVAPKVTPPAVEAPAVTAPAVVAPMITPPVPVDPPLTVAPVAVAPIVTAPAEVTSAAQGGGQGDRELVAFTGGGLLLAGLAMEALKAYRRRQFRLRRPGRVIGATSPSLLGTESAVLTAGKAGYADVTWLDHALRGLVQRLAEQEEAKLPDVVAVRLTGQILELVLGVPSSDAPSPWTCDEIGNRWTLQREHDTPYDGDRRGEFFAPFPTLVSIGYSEDGEHWLVDLERVGALSLTGDPERCLDLARYLAAELAHNTWSEMLSVTMVGFGEELAPMNPDRLTYSADADRAVLTAQRRHHSVVSAMSKIGVDVLTGRFQNIAADAWASHVLFVAPQSADPDGVARLLAAMRESGARAAVAVVLADGQEHSGARWQLTVDAQGVLTIPALNVRVTAQRLPVGEARQLADLLFEAANTPDRAAPPAPYSDNPCDAWYADVCGALREGLVTPPPPTLTLVPPQPAVAPAREHTPDGIGLAVAARDNDPAGTTSAHDGTALDDTVAGDAGLEQAAATGGDVSSDSKVVDTCAVEVDAAPAPSAVGDPAADATAVRASAATEPAAQQVAEPVAEPAEEPVTESAASPAVLEHALRAAGTVAAELREQVVSNHHELDADLEEWWDPASTRPKVTLLGPIRVRAQGPLPADRPREAFHAEVVAYLVTRPLGVRYQTVDNDLFPHRSTGSGKSPVRVRNAISNVRKWLGVDGAGREYLPRGDDNEGYRVVGALVDSDLFRRLRLRSQVEQGANRIRLLHQALDLVTGVPFDDQRDGGYQWLLENPLHTYAQAMIDDVAHEIADYYLPSGERLPADPHRAMEAADVALRAGSTSDTPLLDKMRAAFALGRKAEAETYVRQIVENNPNGADEEDLPKATYDVLLRYRALG